MYTVCVMSAVFDRSIMTEMGSLGMLGCTISGKHHSEEVLYLSSCAIVVSLGRGQLEWHLSYFDGFSPGAPSFRAPFSCRKVLPCAASFDAIFSLLLNIAAQASYPTLLHIRAVAAYQGYNLESRYIGYTCNGRRKRRRFSE